jgi:hypothetical protein
MEVMQQTAAVAGVLLLLGATLWWLRRRGFAGLTLLKKSSGRRLECLERLPLGPQQQALHLVRVGGRRSCWLHRQPAAAGAELFGWRRSKAKLMPNGSHAEGRP